MAQGEESGALFRECIEAAKESQGLYGDCVYAYEAGEYAGMRLFVTPDGMAGVALKADGDMVSVFKNRGLRDKNEKRVDALIALAIAQGARKADCYGRRLVELYGRFGFRAVAKDRFNVQYAPEGMQDEEMMQKAFDDEPVAGRPDVVYLVYRGDRGHVLEDYEEDYVADYEQGLEYAEGEDTYAECVRVQQEAVENADAFDVRWTMDDGRFGSSRAEAGDGGDVSMSVRNLAAVHTLSYENFLAAGKMGGMPLPSVAVTRLDRPYRWGNEDKDVTLVGRPEMVDPERGTQVYERDAWTGSIPQGAIEERNGRMVVNLGWGNYEEATPERLAELMEGRKRRGFEATSNWVDPKEAARAYLARRLRSMDEVKGMRERLSDEEERVVDDEEIEEWMESVSELGLGEQEWQSIFEALADIDEVTEESVREAIMRWEPEGDDFVELWYLKESDAMKEGSEFLQGAVRVISGLREEVRDYLEAVPQRAVGMNEWAYALYSENLEGKEEVRRVCLENGIVPVEYKEDARDEALWDLAYDGEVSFSVIGEHARTWGRYKEKAFAGRDDGRMRAEIDASRARLTGSLGEVKKAAIERVRERAERDKNWHSWMSRGAVADELENDPWASMPLREALEYDELYEAYPELSEMRVSLRLPEDRPEAGAWYDPDRREIFLNVERTEKQWREKLLHEVQHAIQGIEGFARGGSPEEAGSMEDYRRYAGEVEARNVQRRADFSPWMRENLPFNATLDPGEAIVDFSSSVSETLREDVRKAQERKLKAREVVRVSGCPPVLVRLGERDVDVVTTARVLYKLKNEHGLDVEDVMRVVNGMGEPVFVIRDTEGSYILFPGVMARNNNGEMGDVEVALGMERTADGEHFMLSAYALDSLQKVEQLLKGNGRLVYSRYSKAALSSSGVQGGGVSPDFIRLMVERGFDEDTIIGSGDVKGEFSGAVRLLRDGGEMGRVTRGLEEAGRSFKKNEAFVQQMLGEMRKGVERMRRLAGKGRTKREEALAVMGGMVGMVKAVRLYLPRGFGFSVEPYVRQLEVLCELATTGRVELADPIKRVQKELATDAAGEGLHADAEWSEGDKSPHVRGTMYDVRFGNSAPSAQGKEMEEFVKEWADGKVGDVMGRVMGRVAEQLRKYAKREVMLRMEDLLGRMEVKRKNGKLVGGKMDAEGYREMGKVREALGMSEEELEAKLSGLEARLGKAEDEEERGKLEGEMALYSTFGNGRGMSMEGAAAAYEALRVWVGMNRFSWEEAQANQRVARREVVRKVVEALGKARVNEYHAARVRKKPAKEARSIGELLMSAPQTLLAMGRVPGLSELAEDLQRRVNRAGEMMKRWERERWGRLEALARHTLGRSWRGLMDELHGQGETGVAFDRPIRKTVKVGTAYLRELQGMTKRERAEEFARNREAGGIPIHLRNRHLLHLPPLLTLHHTPHRLQIRQILPAPRIIPRRLHHPPARRNRAVQILQSLLRIHTPSPHRVPLNRLNRMLTLMQQRIQHPLRRHLHTRIERQVPRPLPPRPRKITSHPLLQPRIIQPHTHPLQLRVRLVKLRILQHRPQRHILMPAHRRLKLPQRKPRTQPRIRRRNHKLLLPIRRVPIHPIHIRPRRPRLHPRHTIIRHRTRPAVPVQRTIPNLIPPQRIIIIIDIISNSLARRSI